MSLLPHHLENLRASGLADETIRQAKIHSETNFARLAAILNRRRYPRTWGPALCFPFADGNGGTALVRVRPDNPPSRNGRVAKYLQPTGSALRAYFPPGTLDRVHNVNEILITEGEKKALKGWQEGLCCIGLTGVDCWHDKKSSQLIPDLEQISWKAKQVFIIFDSDAVSNQNVSDNERLLGAVLQNRGANVKIVRLPAGENGAKTGLDDYLLSHTADDLRRLMEQAEPPEPPDPGELKCPASELVPEVEADRFLESHKVDDMCRVVFWRDCFWVWRLGRYERVSQNEMQSEVANWLTTRWTKITKSTIANVVAHVQAKAILPDRVEAPCWLPPRPVDWEIPDLVIMKNAVVHLPSLVAGDQEYRIAPTPKLFAQSALEFDWCDASECPPPNRWLEFLNELWPDDAESIEALRRWFGYCLTPDASQHRLLGVFGPKRSGKTTIGRILRELVGPRNTCAPTLSSLTDRFGLWILEGKSLAIIGDARLSGRTDATAITERLLNITGQDPMSYDRKNLPQVTAVFPAKFVLLSNELPRMQDASATIVSRMIVLRLVRSWYGKEDTRLLDKLRQELPGILWWSIAGWVALREHGLLQPTASKDLLEDMQALASPVSAFVDDRCIVGPDKSVERSTLYGEYTNWCQDHGRKHVLDEATFGRDLHSLVPTLRTTRPRRTEGGTDGTSRPRVYVGVGLRPVGG